MGCPSTKRWASRSGPSFHGAQPGAMHTAGAPRGALGQPGPGLGAAAWLAATPPVLWRSRFWRVWDGLSPLFSTTSSEDHDNVRLIFEPPDPLGTQRIALKQEAPGGREPGGPLRLGVARARRQRRLRTHFRDSDRLRTPRRHAGHRRVRPRPGAPGSGLRERSRRAHAPVRDVPRRGWEPHCRADRDLRSGPDPTHDELGSGRDRAAAHRVCHAFQDGRVLAEYPSNPSDSPRSALGGHGSPRLPCCSAWASSGSRSLVGTPAGSRLPGKSRSSSPTSTGWRCDGRAGPPIRSLPPLGAALPALRLAAAFDRAARGVGARRP